MRKRLAEVIAYMDASRERLLATARGINPAFGHVRPASGAWSAAEILEHLSLVEENVARLVSRSVEWAHSHGVAEETSDESVMSSLDKYSIGTLRERIDAPEMLLPSGGKDIEQAVAALVSARDKLRGALIAGDGLDLASVRRPHRVLGDLNLYEWALFVAQHEDRHRVQIERTLEEVVEKAARCAPVV